MKRILIFFLASGALGFAQTDAPRVTPQAVRLHSATTRAFTALMPAASRFGSRTRAV